MANCIITIGRECGSGGHTIGKLLAQRLGLTFYDKEIVEMAAAKTKLSPDFIRTHGEYFQGGSLGHIIGYGTRFDGAVQDRQRPDGPAQSGPAGDHPGGGGEGALRHCGPLRRLCAPGKVPHAERVHPLGYAL